MTPHDLINDLTGRGVRLRAEGDKLKIDAPRGILTAEILEALSTHKPEILEVLTRPRLGAPVRPVPVRGGELTRCAWDNCGGELVTRASLQVCIRCMTWYIPAGPVSEDDQAALNERAAIHEYEGGLSREVAEMFAAIGWGPDRVN